MASSTPQMYPPQQMQQQPQPQQYQYQSSSPYPSLYSPCATLYANSLISAYGQLPPPPPPAQAYAYDESSVGTKRSSDDVLQAIDLLAKRPRPDSGATLGFFPQRPGERLCAFYMTTRTCSFGLTCKFDHPPWVPCGGIPNWKEVTGAANTPAVTDPTILPQRPGEINCAYYMKTGECKYGSRCKFNHPRERQHVMSDSSIHSRDDGVQATQNGAIPGSELVASTKISTNAGSIETPSAHVLVSTTAERGSAKAAPLNSKGLPLRQNELECTYYIKTGSCKFGATCRFHHPEVLRAGPLVPFISPQRAISTMATISYAAVSSIQLHFWFEEIVMCHYSKGYCSSHLQKLHVIKIPKGWYQWLLWNETLCMSKHCTCGACRNTAEYGMATTPLHPQRPGSQDCSYYLKTGECSFGAACKFHHPPNRQLSTPKAATRLTLAGLPRKEDEPVCAYYMKTGACKYGSTCRFDHPPPGEVAAKAAAEATRTEAVLASEEYDVQRSRGFLMQYVDLNLTLGGNNNTESSAVRQKITTITTPCSF